jgi:hypothetical protein
MVMPISFFNQQERIKFSSRSAIRRFLELETRINYNSILLFQIKESSLHTLEQNENVASTVVPLHRP